LQLFDLQAVFVFIFLSYQSGVWFVSSATMHANFVGRKKSVDAVQRLINRHCGAGKQNRGAKKRSASRKTAGEQRKFLSEGVLFFAEQFLHGF
jgi:hypothetical protein